MSVHIYRIELDFHLRHNAIKEMQDAIDSAGMNGQVKIFKTPNQALAAEIIKCFNIWMRVSYCLLNSNAIFETNTPPETPRD